MELDELPSGWEKKSLSDPSVATLNPKKSEVSSLDARLEVTFVPMAAVDESSGTIARPEVRRLGEVKKGYTYFKDGDVIFAKITPCMENGKSAIARGLRNGIGFGSTEFHVVRAGAETQPEWLHLILRSQQVRDDAENSMHGAAGQQRVPIEFLEQLELPVPPLAEQRRIVARVEALTRRLAEASQARQAALAEARTLIEAAMQTAFDESADFTEVPLGDVCTMKTGKTPPTSQPEYFEGDLLFVCPADVGQSLRITTAARRLARKAVIDGKANFFPRGTVLLVGIGSTVGKVGLADVDVCTNQQITGLTFRSGILPDYAAWFLTSQRAVIENAASDGGVPIMNQGGMAELPFCFPESVTEQRAIVARLDAMRGKLDELQRLQREVAAELASFTPALLAKAFRGEL